LRRSRIDSGGSVGVGVAGLGVARIAVGVFLPVLIEHLVAERTFNSEGDGRHGKKVGKTRS